MPFVLNDLDVSDYVERWLSWVESPGARGRATLLRRKPVSFMMGSAFMMSHIAPQALSTESTDPELILYATLAAFQNSRFPDQTGPWPEARVHLELASENARELGRSGVARNLLSDLANESRKAPDDVHVKKLAQSFGGDSAKLAAHDAEMATIYDRDVRAAAVLDPTVTLDQLLLE